MLLLIIALFRIIHKLPTKYMTFCIQNKLKYLYAKSHVLFAISVYHIDYPE